MTASLLGDHAGIIENTVENSDVYLNGWAEILKPKDHKTRVIKEPSDTQTAAE